MAYHPQAFNALVTARQQARASRKSLALCSPFRYCRSPCSGHPTKHAAECPVIILVRCTALLLATGAHNSLDSTVQDGSVRAGHPGGATGGSSRFHGAALKGQSFGRTQGYPTPNPNQDWYPEDWDISDPTPASKFPRPDQKGGQPLQHGKGGKGRGQQNRQDPRGSKRGVPPRGPLQQHQGNAPPPKTASCSIRWPPCCSGTRTRWRFSASQREWWHSWARLRLSRFFLSSTKLGEQWRTTKQSDPGALKHPIRLVLFQALIVELKARVLKLPDGRSGSDLDDRARASQSQSLSGVGALGMPVRQRSDEASGSVIETRAARTLCGGSADHAASQDVVWQPLQFRSALKALRLSNFSNDCYANSSLLAALWTSSFCAAPEVSLRADLARDLAELLRHPSRASHVWSRAPWRKLLRSWPHAGRQQDVADFLLYLQRQAALPLFGGHWITLIEGSLRTLEGSAQLLF